MKKQSEDRVFKRKQKGQKVQKGQKELGGTTFGHFCQFLPFLLALKKKAGLLLYFFVSLVSIFFPGYSRMAAPEPPDSPYGEPVQIGTITSPALTEVSGIAPSRTARGFWWVHNDSGDKPRIYLIDSSGKLHAQFTVTGARNRDWEDMAGYLDGKKRPMLYLADSGDNLRKRDDLTLYRVREPELPKVAAGKLIEGATEPAEAFPFRYPDGHHDAEALFVDPKNGRPYLITKSMSMASAGGVYRFPLPLRTQEQVTLEKVSGSAAERISKLLLVTGAASSPDGSRVVLMTYFSTFEMIRGNGSFESIFDSELTPIRLPLQRQGEAISYTLDGKSIVTTGEKIPAPIFKITR